MVKIAKSRHPVFPIHESIIQRSAQEQRWWKIVSTLCADGVTLKLLFAQLFLFISSVFTELSQICVNNAKPAM